MNQATQDWAQVRPDGNITAVNADALRQQLIDLVNRGQVHIDVNLADVELIDSRGLGLFVVCHQSVSERGGCLRVSGASEDLKGLFKVMRLDQHFEVA